MPTRAQRRKAGKASRSANKPSRKWEIFGILAALTLVSVFAFWGVKDLGFVNYDDDMFITERPELRLGLSPAGLQWALTSPAFPYQNWIPLTLITYLVDYEIGGLTPRVYHVTNLFFHVAAVLLFFWVLYRMTGNAWPSALAAALFAVHPYRVESVAWVSERKDVLVGLFWMLTILAYVRYRERPSAMRYGTVCVTFAAGLMAKPMVMTLPCVLFLLDVWPLKKIDWAWRPSRACWDRIRPYVLDKLPLLALSAAAVVGTYWLQSGAMKLEKVPVGARIGNAAVAYATYLGKTCWPSGLAAFYPHPGHGLPGLYVAGAFVLLGGITAAAFVFRRRAPYFLAGWLWYVGTLAPVIGLLQVGDQAMADRYTYFSVLGIGIAAAWGIWAVISKRPKAVVAATAVVCVIVGALAVATRHQVGYWRDSITLWTHTIEVTGDNAKAQQNLACALVDGGRNNEAREHFTEALRIKPTKMNSAMDLATSFMGDGRFDEAARAFDRVLGIDPNCIAAHIDLGVVRLQQGNAVAAEEHLRRALELAPNNANALFNMGAALLMQGRRDEAAEYFTATLRINPNDQQAKQALAGLAKAKPPSKPVND